MLITPRSLGALSTRESGGSDASLERLTVAGGVLIAGGARHTSTRSDVSNRYGASHGNCVYMTNAGDPMGLKPCDHLISHTEIHDCRGLGVWIPSRPPFPWPYPPNPHDPYPNITGNGLLLNHRPNLTTLLAYLTTFPDPSEPANLW